MSVSFLCKLLFVLLVSARSYGQEYDFGAEISRQCLVPDPVGLLDCVENKVTLPYLTSWVDCTNSLGQNVKTSADIINYRCKSVWEGKEVIPEVFYIKDCVIEKTGLPAKNVSAEVLGAYKECESGATQPNQRTAVVQSNIKTAPIQQQQINTPFQQQQVSHSFQQQQERSNQPSQQFQPVPIQQQAYVPVQQQKIAPVQQQIYTQQHFNPSSYGSTNPAQQMPVPQGPTSRQFFIMYPPAPSQMQQPLPNYAPSFQPQQQLFSTSAQPTSSYGAYPTQQKLPVSSYVPQSQSGFPQQQIKTASPAPYSPQTFQGYPIQTQPAFNPVPSGPYYYSLEIQHPSRSVKV